MRTATVAGNCSRCNAWDDDLTARAGICEVCFIEDRDGMRVVKRQIFTVKLAHCEDGLIYGDTYGEDGMPLCSSEGNSAYQVMLDLARRHFGDVLSL
jgi:hypothetical protein